VNRWARTQRRVACGALVSAALLLTACQLVAACARAAETQASD